VVQAYNECGCTGDACDDNTNARALGIQFKSNFGSGLASLDVKVHYDKVEDLFDEIRAKYKDRGYTIVQSNQKYKVAINEVIAIDGAIWGIGTSLMLCLVAVVLFKNNFVLVGTVMTVIFMNIVIVLGSFSFAGWKLGGIEAVSLSILVGTCVDYCIHMLEGYLESDPDHLGMERNPDTGKIITASGREWDPREWRMRHAMMTVGVPVFHSAITTGGSAWILTFTELPLFNKFGKIICINTAVSIILTMTLVPAMLATCGPLKHTETLKACVIGVGLLCVFFGVLFLLIYIVSTNTEIRGPDGEVMFE